MRLDFEPGVTPMPRVHDEAFAEVPTSDDLERLLKFGITAAQQGYREKAREYLMQAADIGPSNEDAWMWLASISEYPEELLAFLNNVLAINAENAKAREWHAATCSLLAKTFVQRSIAARADGRADQAQSWLDEAISHDPRCVMAWMERSRLSQDEDEFCEILTRVLEIEPGHEEARAQLAELERSKNSHRVDAAKAAMAAGQLSAAFDMLNEVISTDRRNVPALLLRVHLSTAMDAKLRDLETVLEVEPDNMVARSSYDFLKMTIPAEPVTAKEPDPTPAGQAPSEHTEEPEQTARSAETDVPDVVYEHTVDQPQLQAAPRTEDMPTDAASLTSVDPASEGSHHEPLTAPDTMEPAWAGPDTAIDAERTHVEPPAPTEMVRNEFAAPPTSNVATEVSATTEASTPAWTSAEAPVSVGEQLVEASPSTAPFENADQPASFASEETTVSNQEEQVTMMHEGVTSPASVRTEELSVGSESAPAASDAEYSSCETRFETSEATLAHSVHSEGEDHGVTHEPTHTVVEPAAAVARGTNAVHEGEWEASAPMAEPSEIMSNGDPTTITLSPMAPPSTAHEAVQPVSADPFATVTSLPLQLEVPSMFAPVEDVRLDHPAAERIPAASEAAEPSPGFYAPVEAPAKCHESSAPVANDQPGAHPMPCPFCRYSNEPGTAECEACQASLTFADVDAILSNQRADRAIIKNAVAEIEAEWKLRDLNPSELTELSLGYFQLGNFEQGLRCIDQASRQCPDDTLLTKLANELTQKVNRINAERETPASNGTKKILVVDDSATVRKLISSKLEKSGHQVICAEDGIEALARVEDATPDLVLLDIAMPRMDGYEVCKELRSQNRTRDLPVVMISGKDGFFDKVRGRMAGATGYVTKPFGPETLMKALDEYLNPGQIREASFELERQPEPEMISVA